MSSLHDHPEAIGERRVPFDARERRGQWEKTHTFEPMLPVDMPASGISSVFSEMQSALRTFCWSHVYGMNRYRRYLADSAYGATLPLRQPASRWPAGTSASTMKGPWTFVFDGVEHTLPDSRGWRHIPWGEAWLTMLHRFEDLTAAGADERLPWHQAIVRSWAMANLPGRGPAWSPFCLSARIVHWIKWDLRHGGLTGEFLLRSLIVQVRYLHQFRRAHWQRGGRTDVAKALMFAGCYFENSSETRRWLNWGVRAFDSLGANELSNEDMNDLYTLTHIYPRMSLPQFMERRARRALASINHD
ncbi:MAG: hypothetical protein ACODTU_02025 [Pigmentiphaga sp.]|uniref:hypothetical protein n=1 Tax=Pigmentiphaga sp. TaxID=1977564 RepID=UPI003B55E27A